MNFNSLDLKKKQLDTYRPFPREITQNMEDWFKVELTYTSNALEGNTLTRQETAVVIEKGLTVGGKSLKEHLEATNHAQALDYVMALSHKKPQDITQQVILDIHSLILTGIDTENAGHYRHVPVRISGSTVILPNPHKVPDLMMNFEEWLTNSTHLHPIEIAIEAHYKLVTIHPFVDGNGRTARLLMNLILIMSGFPPAIIRPQDRLAYLNALETAQLGGSKTLYSDLMIQSIDRSLDLYLSALGSNTEDEQEQTPTSLLRIGALAKSANETVATIRYWTTEGLITYVTTTKSGYQLYDPSMTERCKRIQTLKRERFTLKEIKQILEQAPD